eukprot:5659374-Pyramimonas_sp.AAC.1
MVVSMISIGAVTGCPVVAVNIASSIAIIIIVPTVVDVAMVPRPPKSPTRIGVPAGMYRAVSAAAFASVAPN